jgi:HEAT repeat protein
VRHLAALLLVLTGLGSVAWAKLEGPAWLDAEQRFRALLAQPGEGDAKAELVKLVASDGQPRAWTLLADGLVLEAAHVARTADLLAKDLAALQELLAKKLKHPAEEDAMYRLQGSVSELEARKSQDERILRQIAAAFGAANEAGRKLVYAKTKAHKDFPVRAAGARVAAVLPDEPASRAVVAEALKDPDPRVRLAVLEGLEKAPGTSWQEGVVARVEDPDWGVQLVAARIAGAREIGKAIPALIRALATCTPRVAEQVVESLRLLTGETIEPYAEAWAKWWEDNRARWGEDGRPLAPLKAPPRVSGETSFYGLKIRSDRVLYIIDTSLSMKDE